MNSEQITEVIRKRRAIFPKTYTDEEIPQEIIEEMLENANWAPTHKLTEPWRFKVFRGESLQALGDCLANAYKDFTPPERYSDIKYNKTKKKPSMCACVIAICMQRDPEERIPEFEEIAAVACAVQNMWLTAAAHNIGAYWSTPIIIASPDVENFLELGEGERCLGFFYMGYHKMPELPGKRTPIEDKVVWR